MSELVKVAAINDLSGASRCSLTVAIPIISAFGLQCCALPTAVLSNHTGYDKYFFDDYTDKMEHFTANWKEYNDHFGCIYTGFLGSAKQIDIAQKFFEVFGGEDTKILVDPVMGDDGRIYSTYTEELCDKMKHLVMCADVVTPNVTEAAILSDVEYTGDDISIDKARKMASAICALGAKNVVITGIEDGTNCVNYLYGEQGEYRCSTPTVPVRYSGTGDVFASVLCGFLARGKSIKDGIEFAAEFVEKATKLSYKEGLTYLEGICFEKFLKDICEL